MRSLTVTGTSPAPRTAARTMSRNSARCTGSAAPPPLRVTLATGQPKLRSMWSARSSPTRKPGGLAHGPRVGAVELDRPHRLVVGEPGHAQGLVVALGEPAGGDHLADEQAAVRRGDRAGRRPGRAGVTVVSASAAAPKPWHSRRNGALVMPAIGRQHDGRPHRERPDPQRGARPAIRRHGARPQVGDGDAELGQQRAQQGQRQAEHRAVVAVDAVDERGAVAVEREPAGHRQRLAGGDVGVDLGVGRAAEAHHGLGDGRGLAVPVAGSTSGVAGDERARSRPGSARHQAVASVGRRGLPRTSPSNASTESHPSTSGSSSGRRRPPGWRRGPPAGRRRPRPCGGEHRGRPGRVEAGDAVLVDAADHDLGREPGGRSRPRRAGEAEARTSERAGTRQGCHDPCPATARRRPAGREHAAVWSGRAVEGRGLGPRPDRICQVTPIALRRRRAPVACRGWRRRPPTPPSCSPTGWSGSAGRRLPAG